MLYLYIENKGGYKLDLAYFITKYLRNETVEENDVIARSTYNIDIHAPSGGGTKLQNVTQGSYYEIPYRAVVPLNCNNLTIGSRCISSDVAVHSSLRIMPTVISIGQGAGVGAALAALNNISPSKVDGKLVREKLIKLGANLQ